MLCFGEIDECPSPDCSRPFSVREEFTEHINSEHAGEYQREDCLICRLVGRLDPIATAWMTRSDRIVILEVAASDSHPSG
ncbi:hypothetical protein C491_20986 [Natronococcus amylolyticus DSM 10524]|uniref:C2H2-type domain-containing protein n=1 Tax=Natronococcus amylolyticus DSM 10524 TaxID=1227497 RepID=L9WW23_9EURY|nr:hypothetical protein C491_20986 [Natronococcus amylolyticus DSM 10524]